MTRHALFATVETPEGPHAVCFRVGKPTTWDRASARFNRLWAAGAVHPHLFEARPARVRHERRWYRVRFMEVRAVDRHGRGLGSERHATAIPVPYRAVARGK